MIATIANPEALRREGFSALVQALGWVNAVRFIQQFEPGQGNYTHERRTLLPGWNADTLIDKANELSVG